MAKRAGMPARAPRSTTRRKRANSEHEAFHRSKAQAWVRDHLSKKFGVRPSKVDLNDRLSDWGYLDAKDLANLAAEFNHGTAGHPVWSNTDIAPPELIKNVKNGTLGELADYIGGQGAAATAAGYPVPPEATIDGFLVNEILPNHHGVDPQTTPLREMNISDSEVNEISYHFQLQYHYVIANILTDAINASLAIYGAGRYIHDMLRRMVPAQ